MNPSQRTLQTLTTAALLFLATGCKPDAALQKGEVVGRGTKKVPGPGLNDPPPMTYGPAAPLAPSGPVGTVSGTILFNGPPPPRKLIDTSMDPACSMAGGSVKTEQFVVDAGKLANVFLYIKSGPQAAMQAFPSDAGTPPVLDQKGCQYTPHVVGVMQGAYVVFRNSDPTMHNVHTMPADVGNDTIDISMGPKGASQTKQFVKPELMIPVRCNNHPWMNAFINVAPTPFFAVSAPDGRYTITGLPPGDYVLGAVHEKLGEKTINLTVHSNQTTKADLSYAIGH